MKWRLLQVSSQGSVISQDGGPGWRSLVSVASEHLACANIIFGVSCVSESWIPLPSERASHLSCVQSFMQLLSLCMVSYYFYYYCYYCCCYF